MRQHKRRHSQAEGVPRTMLREAEFGANRRLKPSSSSGSGNQTRHTSVTHLNGGARAWNECQPPMVPPAGPYKAPRTCPAAGGSQGRTGRRQTPQKGWIWEQAKVLDQRSKRVQADPSSSRAFQRLRTGQWRFAAASGWEGESAWTTWISQSLVLC